MILSTFIFGVPTLAIHQFGGPQESAPQFGSAMSDGVANGFHSVPSVPQGETTLVPNSPSVNEKSVIN